MYERCNCTTEGTSVNNTFKMEGTCRVEATVRFKGSERSRESISRNHVKDRGLLEDPYPPRRTGDGITLKF